ncbi:MAG: serpin family protein, partial [Clostridia bacterium]|nr:serpin family protein [Clostridia bacterium]
LKFDDALMGVVFPKAFAFDDLDSRVKLYKDNPVEESFFEAVNSFSYKTASALLSDSDDNTTYSPVSMYYALALAATGANGETQSEMLNLLGVSDSETLSTQSRYLYNRHYRDNDIIKSRINNSLWLNRAEDFNKEFIENAAENFYAHSFNMDFSDENTAKRMAEWVSMNTGGTIEPEIQLSSQQLMSIFNTVYFSAQWTDEFNKDKTEEDVFYLTDGNTVKVDYLNSKYDSYRYVVGDNYISSSLALKDGAGMFFILPDEGVSPRELMENAESVDELINNENAFAGEVTWQVPKFSFDSSISAKDALIELGIKSAFDYNADFSGITSGIAFIDNISQDTHIAIDEKGVTASAFTSVQYTGAALPVGRADMILNRPFIFGISYNGTLLFIGICDNPAK